MIKKIFTVSIILFFFLNTALVNGFIEETIVKESYIFNFSNLDIKDRENCLSITLEGSNAFFNKPNHYILPMSLQSFYLPIGTKIKNIKCTPSKIHEILVSKDPAYTPEKTLIKNYNDRLYYEEGNPKSPPGWFSYNIGTGIVDQQRSTIVNVQLFPIQFDSSKSIITWTECMEIEIEYNPPAPTYKPKEEIFDLLIISPNNYRDNLKILVNHKIGRGISTKWISIEDILQSRYFLVKGRDTPEKIKYFIKNSIENWDTKYVLLVGGANQIPTRYTHIYHECHYQDEFIFITDLYYADIYDENLDFSSWDTNENNIFGEKDWYGKNDTVDLYPDVYLGRLACVNEEEVDNCVTKITKYENYESHKKNWFRNVIFIGGDSSPGDDEEIDEGEYIQGKVEDLLNGFLPVKIWASNENLYDKSNINNAINGGAGFVFFNGHGNEYSWGTHPHGNKVQWIPQGLYQTQNINNLKNGNMLPIVISDACFHCAYDSVEDCFGWTFVKHPSGGSIAYLGGSNFDLAIPGSMISNVGIEKMCIDLAFHYTDRNVQTLGELCSKVINSHISPHMENSDYINLEEFHIFGDPSLTIATYSTPPTIPDFYGPSSGRTGINYQYFATTTDPEDDNIYYLFDWGDKDYSEWIGPYASGEKAYITHSWKEKGNHTIRVMARDENGVTSQWSGSLNVVMRYSKPNLNNLLIYLFQLIYNWLNLILIN
jgi:hypothetical protein